MAMNFAEKVFYAIINKNMLWLIEFVNFLIFSLILISILGSKLKSKAKFILVHACVPYIVLICG